MIRSIFTSFTTICFISSATLFCMQEKKSNIAEKLNLVFKNYEPKRVEELENSTNVTQSKHPVLYKIASNEVFDKNKTALMLAVEMKEEKWISFILNNKEKYCCIYMSEANGTRFPMRNYHFSADNPVILRLHQFKNSVQKCFGLFDGIVGYEWDETPAHNLSAKDLALCINQPIFEHGDTALHQAVRHNNTTLIDWLLRHEAQASVQSKNLDDQTPLDLAQQVDNPAVIALLTTFLKS